MFRTILETPFLVDLQVIQKENFKLTVIQDYSNSSSKGFRGSNITMASSFLGASLGPSSAANHHQQLLQQQHGHGSDMSSVSSMGSSNLSTYSRAQGQQRVVR